MEAANQWLGGLQRELANVIDMHNRYLVRRHRFLGFCLPPLVGLVDLFAGR